jgi:hypothetical protein
MSLIIFAIVAAFLQLCIHEASHLLAAYLFEARKPLAFHPYPGKLNGKWVFAYCKYDEKPKATKYNRWIHAAPLWGSVAAGTSAFVAVVIFPSVLAYYYLVSGFSAVDIVFFWCTFVGGSKTSDGQRFREACEIDE